MRSTGVRTLVLAVGAALLVSPSLRADREPSRAHLGQKIANFTLRDAAGKPFALHDVKGKKAVVVVFLSFDCPVATSYLPHLADLHRDYGCCAEFIGVCPSDDTAEGVAKLAREYQVPFPVYQDAGLVAADALAATVTPEAFVLDGGFVLRYRGRIDDAYYARLKRKVEVTRHDLRDAIQALFDGQPVKEPATQAVGCAIVRGARPKPAAGRVTYYKDVLPILQNHCQTCHRPGEAGPFPLMTYKQAVNWAEDIKTYTQSRQMPPWKPVEGAAFRDERRLADQEIATLAAWVDGGTPAGDPQDAPPPRKFIDGWQLGQPDLILTPEAEFTLGGSGRDLFRCFVLPTNLPEDKYVTAVEFRPGNARVTHHALLFVDTLGRGRKLADAQQDKEKGQDTDIGPGYTVAMGVGFVPSGGLGGWAPGQLARHLPAGTSYYLPRGSDVIAQVHYHRDGRVEKDRLQIGLHFAKEPVSKRYQGVVIPGRFLAIPANNDNYRVTGTAFIDQDIDLHSVMPHMHMLGKKIKVTITPPGEKALPLLTIDDWDYNWQETYFLKEPMKLKAGTRFDVEAFYDNSAKNPRNPFNPPRLVFFGEQTTNEMCFVFQGATSNQGRIRARPTAP